MVNQAASVSLISCADSTAVILGRLDRQDWTGVYIQICLLHALATSDTAVKSTMRYSRLILHDFPELFTIHYHSFHSWHFFTVPSMDSMLSRWMMLWTAPGTEIFRARDPEHPIQQPRRRCRWQVDTISLVTNGSYQWKIVNGQSDKQAD